MTEIKPVFFNTIQFYKKSEAGKTKPISLQMPAALNKDTISFSGRININDFLKLPKKEIIEKAIQAKTKSNFLGAGGEAEVYRIPDTKYCVRFVKKQTDLPKSTSFRLTETDKINHIAAKLGRKASIMHYIEGENCFAYKNKKELSMLPTESYHRLFRQICHAKENNMIFDCDATNIIYNPKDKSLTAIDFYQIDKNYPENVHPLSTIYRALRMHNTTEGFDAQYNKMLAGGLLEAGLKEFESGVKPCINISDIDFSRLFSRFEELNQEKLPVQYEFLKETITDIQCLKFKELIGEDVKNELSGKIKFAKALIDQVLCERRNSNFKNVVLWQ